MDWGNKRGSSKAPSRFTPLKQKAGAIKSENGTSKGEHLQKETVTPSGKTVSPKVKTPAKVKVSPEQSKVGLRSILGERFWLVSSLTVNVCGVFGVL